MMNANKESNSFEIETTLAILNAIEGNSKLTQRSIANELGIALGLANTYLKRCINKGLIKITQAPANRYAYYLTPRGFREKGRLTTQYLKISFQFFRTARLEFESLFETCVKNDWSRVALCGQSDMVEVAIICAGNYPVTLVGIVDPQPSQLFLSGLSIHNSLNSLTPIDSCIITDMTNPQLTFDNLIEELDVVRVLAPGFTNISRQKPTIME
jgi:DNA-binding MarR family transcriptional regulator